MLPSTPYLLLRPANVVAAAAGYTAQGVYLDGSTTLKLAANFTGIVDSKVGTISLWFRGIGGDASNQLVFEKGFGSGGNITLFRLANGTMRFFAQNSAGVTILQFNTTATFFIADNWKHLVASWDLGAGTAQCYVEDVSDITITTNTNDTIDYLDAGTPQWFIMENGSPGNADLADFYFNPAAFIDLSVTANRRKFITAGLAPVNLGADGSTPTGTAPIMYMSGATASWNTNKGTGGGFTVLSGSVVAAGSNPP